MEILFVIAIIGILVIIVMEVGGAAKAGARDNQRKTDIRLIQLKLESYRGQYGVYPMSLNGSAPPPTLVSSGFISALIIPKDPSTNLDYQYFPLGFSGVCDSNGSASYYLSATLENVNHDSRASLTDGLWPCGTSSFTPSNDPKTYDVASSK